MIGRRAAVAAAAAAIRRAAGAPPFGVPPPVARQVTSAGDRRGAGAGAFLLAIMTAGALAHVAVRLKGLDVAYALGHERRVAADLEEQRRGLQIEIGMLKDPGRVVMIARDRLKMGPPAAEAIRTLGPGSILTAPGIPSGPLASLPPRAKRSPSSPAHPGPAAPRGGAR
jgi:cell division protein FtsL